MRILLTAHQFFPRHFAGTEVLTRDTAAELADRGHEVHVLTVEPDIPASGSSIEVDRYEISGCRVHSMRLPQPENALERLQQEYDNRIVGPHVESFLAELRPDVVHMFHLARLSGSTLDACAAHGLPTVLTVTDFWVICARNTLAKPSGELCSGPNEISSNCLECRRAERWFGGGLDSPQSASYYDALAQDALWDGAGQVRNMDLVRTTLGRTLHLRERVNRVGAILAPTQLTVKVLKENGIDPTRVHHAPYGMNLTSMEAVRDRRANGTGPVRFGFIGTINARKGVDILVRAFRKLPTDARATLRICGNVESTPDFGRRLFSLAGDDRRITFAGPFPNSQMAAELEMIDALVVPSVWYENAPLVVYSALAAGVPVIATDLGGLTELVRHGENGLTFGSGDADELAERLRLLVDDRDQLARLSEGAKPPRTVADSVTEMLGFYEQLGADTKVSPGIETAPVPVPSEPVKAAAMPASRPARTSAAAARMTPRAITNRRRRAGRARGSQVPKAGSQRVGATGPVEASPMFFLVGRAKSGTSWLMRMLNAHPEILCRGEGRFFGAEYRRPDARSLYGALLNSPELEAWLGSSPWTRDRESEDLVAEITGAVTRHVLGGRLAESGKRIVGDKTPFTGVDVVAEIAEICPDSKVVHIIRDGRDVAVSAAHHVWNNASAEGGIHELSDEALSKRERYRSDPAAFGPGGESIFCGDELAGVARDWSESVRASRKHAADRLDGRYEEVRYEDLLDDPAPHLKRIVSFLGAETRDKLIARCIEAASFERMSKGRRQGEEDSTSFMRKGIAGDWRNVFNEADREEFKSVGGDMLIELGYAGQDRD